jgi:hypothetical protein
MPAPPPAATLAAMNRQSSRPAAVIVTAAAALLAAACGSSAAPTGSAAAPSPGSTAAEAVAYAQCMRTHGVPEYPAPANGQMQKITSGQQVGVSDATLGTARNACESLWPYQALTPAQQQQELTEDLKFAQCMRSHGLPAFPDPVATNGQVEFVISTSKTGINPHSPQILAKVQQCMRVLPPGTQRPSAVEVP